MRKTSAILIFIVGLAILSRSITIVAGRLSGWKGTTHGARMVLGLYLLIVGADGFETLISLCEGGNGHGSGWPQPGREPEF